MKTTRPSYPLATTLFRAVCFVAAVPAMLFCAAGCCATAPSFSGKKESVPASEGEKIWRIHLGDDGDGNAPFVATLPRFLPPPAGGETLVLKHKIRVRRQGRAEEYTGIFKWSDREIVVSATSDVGRLFTVRFSRENELRGNASALLPAEVSENLHYALWDLELLFFPPKEMEKTLPAGLRLEDKIVASPQGGQRLLRHIFRGSDGACLVQISFSDAENPLFSDEILLENFVRDYAYTLTLLP